MNPFLKKLGFDANDRAVVIHADDVGMCQASTEAFADLLDVGLVTSGSIMVPCAWFPSVAAFCKARPEADLGIHATLTCEYASYRWGPLTGRDPSSGLLAEDGCLPDTPQHVWQHADANAAVHEIESQIEKALASSIDVTHLDDHMASMLHPRLLPHFVDIALRYCLPLRFEAPAPRSGESDWDATVRCSLQPAVEAGMPFFDSSDGLPLEDAEDHVGRLRSIFENFQPGTLNLVVAHPAKHTPELRAIATDDWPGRVANYHAFMDRGLREVVRQRGIRLVGFRAIRDAFRAV